MPSKLRAWWRAHRTRADGGDEEIQQEFEAHLALLAERYAQSGLTQEEARIAARRQFGNLTLFREEIAEARGWGIAGAWTELRHAALGVWAGRRATAVAFTILCLALAAGALTFSIVDAVALRPLPFADAHRLVAIAYVNDDTTLQGAPSQDFLALREATNAFDAMAGAITSGAATVRSGGAVAQLQTARVTANLFDVLGVRLALGRGFVPEEESRGSDHVVVLTHTAWNRLFNGDLHAVGKRIAVDQGETKAWYEVVGVLPPDVTYPVTSPQPIDLFRPYVPTSAERDPAATSWAYAVDVVGRLRPSVTLAEARNEVERTAAALRAAYAVTRGRPVVLSLHDRVVGSAQPWLPLALFAVGCVVFAGCANAASLLLARNAGRTREFAVRAALGASRGRLSRVLLLEGLLLASAASGVALALAYWGVILAKPHLPEGLPRAEAIAVNARVLAVSITAALCCGLIAGGISAWSMARSDLFAEMKHGGPSIGSKRQTQVFGIFLTAELAFVTLLVITTTLVVTSFVVVTTTNLGFDRQNVFAIDVSRSVAAVPRDDRSSAALAFFAEVLERARPVAGVKAAALIAGGPAPLVGASTRYSLTIPGIGEVRGEDMFETRAVSPEYFSVMGLQLLRGRHLTAGDRQGARRVAIINELAAKRYFADKNPVGQFVGFRGDQTEIIGVVQDVRFRGPEAGGHFELYVALAQEPHPFSTARAELVIRATDSAPATATAVLQALRSTVDGASSPPQVWFLDRLFGDLTASRRFNAAVMSAFGIAAVVLGAFGVYGTIAFLVSQRARDIAIRVALGASQAAILRSVLWTSLQYVAIGAVIGMMGARATAGVVSSLVFGIETVNVTVYALATLGLAAVALLAAAAPARRASRVDPLHVLRAE